MTTPTTKPQLTEGEDSPDVKLLKKLGAYTPNEILTQIDNLSKENKEFFFELLDKFYCNHCHAQKKPDEHCYCWDDDE